MSKHSDQAIDDTDPDHPTPGQDLLHEPPRMGFLPPIPPLPGESLPELATKAHAETQEREAREATERNDARRYRALELLRRLIAPNRNTLPDSILQRIRHDQDRIILDGVVLTVEHSADDHLQAIVPCGPRDNSGHVPTTPVKFRHLHELHDVLLRAERRLNGEDA